MKHNSTTKSVPEWNIPSGFRIVWNLWRHCLCRNGFYPLIVAPFVTAAFILDIYSSTGCRFMHLDVENDASITVWNLTEVDLGVFYYRDVKDFPTRNLDWNFLHYPSTSVTCKPYDSSPFMELFPKGDRIWKVSQILALISGGAGCLGTVLIWIMIVTPLTTRFFWSGVLLPSMILEVLTGIAKFLIFDAKVCKEKVWIQEGETFQQAMIISAHCFMTSDSIVNIVAIILSLMSVILICIRVPKRRILAENCPNHTDHYAFQDYGVQSNGTRTPRQNNFSIIKEDTVPIYAGAGHKSQISISDLDTATFSYDEEDSKRSIFTSQSCANDCLRDYSCD